MQTFFTLLTLLLAQTAYAGAGVMMTTGELKSELVTHGMWNGSFKTQNSSGAFMSAQKVSLRFRHDGKGHLSFTISRDRAAINSNEIDDGTCNEGKTLTRTLAIDGKRHLSRTSFPATIFARECESGIIGSTKKIRIRSLKIDETGKLILVAPMIPGLLTGYIVK